MAAVTTMLGVDLAVWETLNSADSTTILDPLRAYEVTHNGVDTSGSPATDPVTLAVDRTVATTPATDTGYDGGTNKYILLAGKTLPIGPGVHRVSYRVPAAASAATLSVVATPKYFLH